MHERCKSLSSQNVQCGLPEGHWGSHTNSSAGYGVSWIEEDKDKEKFYRGKQQKLNGAGFEIATVGFQQTPVDEPASETSYKTLWGEEKKEQN